MSVEDLCPWFVDTLTVTNEMISGFEFDPLMYSDSISVSAMSLLSISFVANATGDELKTYLRNMMETNNVFALPVNSYVEITLTKRTVIRHRIVDELREHLSKYEGMEIPKERNLGNLVKANVNQIKGLIVLLSSSVCEMTVTEIARGKLSEEEKNTLLEYGFEDDGITLPVTIENVIVYNYIRVAQRRTRIAEGVGIGGQMSEEEAIVMKACFGGSDK